MAAVSLTIIGALSPAHQMLASPPIASSLATTTRSWEAFGTQDNAQLGYAVDIAGDVNGDGYDDLIVGAPYYHNGQTNEGIVLVYHGAPTGLPDTPNWVAEGNRANALFGHSVAAAGDVNNDGYDDVIIGAPGYTTDAGETGAAFVYLGSATGLRDTPKWTRYGEMDDAEYGYDVAGAGDVNGDGYADVIIGAPRNTTPDSRWGKAYVHYGANWGVRQAVSW